MRAMEFLNFEIDDNEKQNNVINFVSLNYI